MRPYLITLVLCVIFSNGVAAQAALQAIEAGEFGAAEASLRAALAQEPENPEACYGLARLYAEQSYTAYNPDTAYTYLRLAQRYFRRLSKGRQNKLERQDAGADSMRKLRNELREKGLVFALEKGSSEAITHYMELYSRLNQEYETRAMSAFLQLRFEELKEQGQYDSLRLFALAQEGNFKEYLPASIPALHDAVITAFFRDRDSSQLDALYFLLKNFPPATRRLDAPLSAALMKSPYITQAENQLRGADFRYLPKTVAVIYYYHYITGEWSDLLGFQNRYPEYADSFGIQRAFAIARSAPDLKEGFTENRRAVYERYIQQAAPAHKAYRALLQAIAPDLESGQWARAAATAERFAPAFGEGNRHIQGLLEILNRPEEGLEPERLAGAVNSSLGEYSPVISADGQRLYFCRNLNGNEDIFWSERQGDSWPEAFPLEALNTEESHEAPLALSSDGTTLLMYDGGIVKYTNKTAEGWSAPHSFFNEYAAPEWQGTTAFASNREAAIFAARTINVVGARNEDNIDLFVSFRRPDGSWTPPANLGPTLNTPFEDRSPFLHPDMRTLYFSSAGHSGLGKLDVYVTTRVGEGWFDWTEPANLGKEINGPGNDWGYRITTDGTTAYFSGSVQGEREDLYQVGVPERYRPQPVTAIAGRLLGLDGQPVKASIVLEDLSTGEEAGIAMPDPETGAFFITLPSGKLYSYTVSGEGLYPQSNNIDLRKATTGHTVAQDITAPTIEEIRNGGISLSLNNLFFDTDKYEIKPESFPELNRLAELLQSYGLVVEIAGHTDNVGAEAYNQELSQNRASAVRSYLLDKGCLPRQATARGYGLSQPIAGNDTEAGRALNRRVEIRFIGESE